jgi:hypothetical protein
MDPKELLILCKRHFGNGNISAVVAGFKKELLVG